MGILNLLELYIPTFDGSLKLFMCSSHTNFRFYRLLCQKKKNKFQFYEVKIRSVPVCSQRLDPVKAYPDPNP